MVALVWVLAACVQASASVYEEAASLLQRGQTDAAIQLLEKTLEQSPKDLKARTLMGMAFSAAGRLDEAGRQFTQALDVDPKFSPALKNLAVNEMAQGQIPKARQHFEQLLALTPSDPVAHLALAEILFGAQDYAGAVAHFQKSGELYLREPRTIIEYARACVEGKQEADAPRILAHVPKEADAAVHFQAGTLLALLTDYAGAARELELAKDHYSDPYEAGYNLTLAYVKGANYPAAIRTAEGLIGRGYKKAELYNLLSQAYESKGMTREAYGALRTATQVDPEDEANYIDLVALCLTHKNYDLALEIANIGLTHRPSSDRLVVQRGIVFAMTEKFNDARKAFEAARTMAPEKGLPHVALGLILMQNDRIEDAIGVLRRRVQTAGNDYIALWFLAEALNRSGATAGTPQMTEAIDAAERSVRLNPDVAQSQMLVAKLQTRAGKLDVAVKHLARALQLEPDNVSAMYQLAQVYSRKGDSARAKELFAKVGKAKAEDREQFTSRGLAQIIREGAK